MFFKEKLLGNYVKYSKSTAKENPEMIKLYYENRIEEEMSKLKNLEDKVKDTYVCFDLDNTKSYYNENYEIVLNYKRNFYIDIEKNKIFIDPKVLEQKIQQTNYAKSQLQFQLGELKNLNEEYSEFIKKWEK